MYGFIVCNKNLSGMIEDEMILWGLGTTAVHKDLKCMYTYPLL